METLTKRTIRLGNSAGVLLPAGWLNGIVEVKLVETPVKYHEITNKILIILKDKLSDIKGLAITGSYARNEQTKDSDIDILGISKNQEEHIKAGKYDILLVSEEKIKKDLENNILPLLPMLREAKPIINGELIETYSKYPITKKNIKWYIDTTKQMMKEVKEDIDFSKQTHENISDASAYSLILRLRTLYILDCLRKDKIWKKNDFLNLIKKISDSLNAYNGYLRVKNKKNKKAPELKIKEAERLMNYISEKTEETEKWLKERKD